MASVMTVVDVELKIIKSNPPQWSITAIGTVNSGGWTNPRLRPRFYPVFPDDGIQDFVFDADPPDGIAIQPVLPIAATELWPNPPKHVKGVRINSASNSIEVLAGSAQVLTIE